MADSIRLKTTYVEQQDPERAQMYYDRELDTLYIRLDAFGDLHVAHYLDDGVYALFDPETMEVVGFQVENWERVFLNCLHPDLKRVWSPPERREDKTPIIKTVRRYAPDYISA